MHTIECFNLQNSYMFWALLAHNRGVLGHTIISSIIGRGEYVHNSWCVHSTTYRQPLLLCTYSPLYIIL
jgi:hypothetical protein